MNPCHDNLAASLFCKPFHFSNDILRSAAPDPAAHERDNAVRAKLIAAILYLNMSAGMILTFFHPHFFINIFMGDIWHSILQDTLYTCVLSPVSFPFLQKGIQYLHDIFFAVVPHREIYARIHPVVLIRLHITSHRYDYCVRIVVLCPMEHLSALSVRDIRNRTCINNINIGIRLKRYNTVTALL